MWWFFCHFLDWLQHELWSLGKLFFHLTDRHQDWFSQNSFATFATEDLSLHLSRTRVSRTHISPANLDSTTPMSAPHFVENSSSNSLLLEIHYFLFEKRENNRKTFNLSFWKLIFFSSRVLSLNADLIFQFLRERWAKSSIQLNFKKTENYLTSIFPQKKIPWEH